MTSPRTAALTLALALAAVPSCSLEEAAPLEVPCEESGTCDSLLQHWWRIGDLEYERMEADGAVVLEGTQNVSQDGDTDTLVVSGTGYIVETPARVLEIVSPDDDVAFAIRMRERGTDDRWVGLELRVYGLWGSSSAIAEVQIDTHEEAVMHAVVPVRHQYEEIFDRFAEAEERSLPIRFTDLEFLIVPLPLEDHWSRLRGSYPYSLEVNQLD